MSTPAPLLSPTLVEHAKQLGSLIRQQRVAALVGSGISCQVGLPRWSVLISQLVAAWNEWDTTKAKGFPPDNYFRLYQKAFGSDLAMVTYLQRAAAEAPKVTFGKLLYSALYSTGGEHKTPEPNHVHRHLVALFQDHPKEIWTTNYDDLLEQAAILNGQTVRSLDLINHQIREVFLVSHLHGYVPPVRYPDTSDPTNAQVILAEDDYHALTMAAAGWTNREFYRLFDDHRVLILGMSLDDRNLRRVLATLPAKEPDEPKHFALLRATAHQSITLPRIREKRRRSAAATVDELQAWYWKRHGVQIISLESHDEILPFLVRLRYESYGDRPGSLWAIGSQLGYQTINPHDQERKQIGHDFLRQMGERLITDFSLDPSELIEIGVFLLKGDANQLELAFRSGAPGFREFSADPDHPTGLAGRVFVSGDMVRIERGDPLHDYGIAASIGEAEERYEGIISVPLIDWDQGGIPVGVAYITVSTTDGKLFQLSNDGDDPMQKTLNDLYNWMSKLWPVLHDALEGITS